MNAKQKRHAKFQKIIGLLYFFLLLTMFYFIGQKDHNSIFFIALIMFLLYLVSATTSSDTVQTFAEKLESEEKPRMVRVKIYGFKPSGKNKPDRDYTASFLVTRNRDITPSDDFGIVEMPEVDTQKMLGSPPWHKIVDQPNSIVMLGKVFTFTP